MPERQPLTPEPTSAPSLGYLVWHLSLRWQGQLGRALETLGVTPAEYAVLASLRGLSASGVAPSQRELSQFSGLEPMYVSKLVRALESDRLVERSPHPAEPRAVQCALTRRGEKVVGAARKVVLQLEEERLADIGGPTSKRAKELRATLTKLLQQASATSSDGAVL